MEAYELSKLINSIDSILLQDVSTIKTISSTEMWPPIYVCNLYIFVPIFIHFCSKIGETLTHLRRFGQSVLSITVVILHVSRKYLKAKTLRLITSLIITKIVFLFCKDLHSS